MLAETGEATERITEADLDWWLAMEPALDWIFAVTYAEGAPHEYVAAGHTGDLTGEDFVRAARVICTFGEPMKFYKDTRIYLTTPRGWKHWTMDSDVTRTGLINRGRAEHTYGVQNAPRTRAPASTPYDEIASFWDSTHAALEPEREAIANIVMQMTDGRKVRTLDIGCGTGLALDCELTNSVRYVGIDPSQAMLNVLVRKYPHLAGVHPMTFSDAITKQVLGATRFDLVLALGGAASYLTSEDFAQIPVHARGGIVLSAFAHGRSPVTQDLTEADLAAASTRLRVFAATNGGKLEHVGRFDIAIVQA